MLVNKKPFIYYSVFLLIMLLCLITTDNFAQVIDSLTNTASPNGAIDVAEDNFQIFLMVFAASVITSILIIAFVGGCLIALILAAVTLLAIWGVISVSFVSAIVNRSWTVGAKTFLYISSLMVGAVSGIPLVWLMSVITRHPLSIFMMITLGVISGLIGGLLLYRLLILFVNQARYYLTRMMEG